MTSRPEEESVVRSPESGEVDSEAADAAENAEQEAVEADLDSLLADVQRERDEYLQLAQRARADFENFRKRAASETADAERRGTLKVTRDLLPVIDNLARALDAASADDPLRQGVELVHGELGKVLERAGVVAYDPTGERSTRTSTRRSPRARWTTRSPAPWSRRSSLVTGSTVR